jgi:hypothetical protein
MPAFILKINNCIRLAVTSKPILVVINKVDILREMKNVTDYSSMMPLATQSATSTQAAVTVPLASSSSSSYKDSPVEIDQKGPRLSLRRKLLLRKSRGEEYIVTPQADLDEIAADAAAVAAEAEKEEGYDPAWDKIFSGKMPVVKEAAPADGDETGSGGSKENTGGRDNKDKDKDRARAGGNIRSVGAGAVGGADSRRRLSSKERTEASRPKSLEELTALWAERLPKAGKIRTNLKNPKRDLFMRVGPLIPS